MKNPRLDVNGSDNKPFPQEENFLRNDTGIYGAYPMETNPAEDQSANFFNGNSDKPFPEDRNFTMDVASTQPTGMGEYVPQTDHKNVANTFGQIKYARREGAISIYKDETRETANDKAASAKAEGSVMGCDIANEDSEENQGI